MSTSASERSRTAGRQRVYLHVGAPKTGTTFLQRLLLEHRDDLRRRGVLYPADTYDRHFFAAVDLQDGYFHGSPRPKSAGHWPQVAADARAWAGTSVISHEVFAAATAEQAQRAVADLAPAEVHIIYTARDLGRGLTSRWQEDVKHGMTDSFEQWWAAVLRRDEGHAYARWFWRTDDPTDVLGRWGAAVGAERFHLVTVPREGGPGELWRRFAGVVGFDADLAGPESSEPKNPGLGIPEVELVRRVNGLLGGSLPPTVYGRVVKGVLSHETLTRHVPTRRLALPDELFPTVERMAQEWLAVLQDRGVDVVGDVADLLPVRPATAPDHPDSATQDEVADVAAWAVKELLLRLQTERGEHAARVAELEARLAATPVEAVVHWVRKGARRIRALDPRARRRARGLRGG